jgi:hypothetical protein
MTCHVSHLILFSLVFLNIAYGSNFQTNDTTHIQGGNVDGVWPVQNSPYLIHGDITIPSDSTLTIEAGSVVEFQGPYALHVQGRLLALGTEGDSILFTINDTTGFDGPDASTGGWRGICFLDTPVQNDSSKTVYCRFEYGKSPNGGAVCLSNFSKVEIAHSTFCYNRAIHPDHDGAAGGAIHAAGSEIRIIGNMFIHNQADWGGAVQLFECSPFFADNVYQDNYARDGGAVAISGISNPTFHNDTFENNQGVNSGGGLALWDPAGVTLHDVTFAGNTAHWGSGVGNIGGTLLVNGCEFIENKAETFGGGIASDFGNVEIESTEFLNNHADWGGGIHLWETDLGAHNCVFEKNTSTGLSGGIHADFSEADLQHCSFIDNSADLSGGIHSWYSEIDIGFCRFENNISSSSGAGLHADFSNIRIDSTLFSKNTAQWGAAVQVYNTDLAIDSCMFDNNRAEGDHGGAVDFYADSITLGRPYKLYVTQSRFIRNTAETHCGAIRIEQSDKPYSMIDVRLDKSDFQENRANRYASFRISGMISDFIVKNCLFAGNTASQWVAGPGFITNCSGRIDNCIFASNYTSYSDSTKTMHGASAAFGADVDIFNCTFSDTSGVDGVGFSARRGGKTTLTNSIFRECGNRPISLTTALDMGVEVFVNFCNVQYGQDSIHVSDSLSVLHWGEGNIDADPLFVSEAGMDYHLQSSSPCIGSGVNCLQIEDEWLCAPTFDMEGHRRPYPRESESDMGAFESALGMPTKLDDQKSGLPGTFVLFQNYPNPFNSTTTIRYRIPVVETQNVAYLQRIHLTIHNILGKKIATLVSKKQTAGDYTFHWDASELSSGLYYYRLAARGQAKEYTQTKKMILLR